MASANPYQSPRTDVTAPPLAGVDQTGPFDYKGRFGRLSYIAWLMAVNFFATLIQMVIGIFIGVSGSADGAMAATGVIMDISWAISLVFAVIGTIFVIRRLHDIDLSGWWVLYSSLIGIVSAGLIVAGVATQSTALMVLGGIAMLFLFAFGIYILVKPGAPDANRFGPPRETRGWEKVVGIIGIVLMVLGPLALIGLVVATALNPEMMDLWSQAM